MYEAEIEYQDGSIDTYYSFSLDVLFRALEEGEIVSFTVRLRTHRISENPFKKNP